MIEVAGQSQVTFDAKRRDLQRFLAFYQQLYGYDRSDEWFVSVTKAFLKHLRAPLRPLAGPEISRPVSLGVPHGRCQSADGAHRRLERAHPPGGAPLAQCRTDTTCAALPWYPARPVQSRPPDRAARLGLAHFRSWVTSLPDSHRMVQDLMAEGDKVVAHSWFGGVEIVCESDITPRLTSDGSGFDGRRVQGHGPYSLQRHP